MGSFEAQRVLTVVLGMVGTSAREAKGPSDAELARHKPKTEVSQNNSNIYGECTNRAGPRVDQRRILGLR